MSKNIDIDKVKEIPIIEDKRDKDNKSKSLIISNYEYLDKVMDKKEIEQRLQEQQEKLHKPFYSIDLNTSRVKQNIQATFILSTNKTIHNISYAEDIDNDLHNDYLKLMQKYNDVLNDFIGKKYTSFDDLDKDIVQFNMFYDTNYYNGFNLRVKDFLDSDIKKFYVNQYASAIASLQLQEINSKYKDIKDILDVDIDNIETDSIINKKWFKETQKIVKDYYKDASDDADKQDIDRVIFNVITEMIYQEQVKLLDETIQKNNAYYKKVNELYSAINKKILDIATNFNDYSSKLKDYTQAVAPKQADNKPINLHLAKMFNNTYPLNKLTSIDKNKNERYDIRLKLIYEDTDFNDLRNIIFVDDINNQQISLLPIDLAFFIGFTTINSVNGGNIPITLTDVIKYISEDKKARVRKSQKAYQLYDNKMQMFKSFKVKSVIKDRKTNKTLIEFKDAVPILENYKVHLANRGDNGYIIGASAILSILNFLSEQEDIDYLTTFSNANNYINDKQSNTIETLNMKYYIIIKVLQMSNAKKRGIKYNPKINLDDLYTQTALLKEQDELSRDDKKRLRQKINIYLEHLKAVDLIDNYDYKPFNQLTTNDANNSKLEVSNNASKNNLYINVK